MRAATDITHDAEQSGAQTSTLVEPTQDINSLLFLNIGVKDTKSDSFDARAEVVPHMAHDHAVVQEDG